MCICQKLCPKCDSGIDAYYNQRLKETELALKKAGINANPEDYLDAKDVWYEYCQLKDQEETDDLELDIEIDLSNWPK